MPATTSVSALATSEDNEVLAAGDSSGLVKIWSIADYCCKLATSKADPPTLLSSWTAHAGAIVSLQLIEKHKSHNSGGGAVNSAQKASCLPEDAGSTNSKTIRIVTTAAAATAAAAAAAAGTTPSEREMPQLMLLSASADKTVRLWKIDGTLIGTFGQKQPWDISTVFDD